MQNQEFCSISKPERLRNRSIPNAFGIREFRSHENAEIEQKNGFAKSSQSLKKGKKIFEVKGANKQLLSFKKYIIISHFFMIA